MKGVVTALLIALVVQTVRAAADAKGYFLREAAEKENARCLDGTPGVYYHRPGSADGTRKWYIHHQGGGWCESLEHCHHRAQNHYGSSKTYPMETNLNLRRGYFSSNSDKNPQMYNWNTVFIRYCDGGSFTGSNSSTTIVQGMELFFRGKHILKAVIDDLLDNRGLSNATDVVVSGCSAGGLATYLHLDHWASRMPPTAKVRGLPDSGFFVDHEGPPHYHSAMHWLFYHMNSSSAVNSACLRAHSSSNDPHKCIFAQYAAPHIQTPFFPLQSQYDAWQVGFDLGVPTSDISTINEWGRNITALIRSTVLNRPQNSVFLDSCFHHCGEWDSIRIDGKLSAMAFQEWYDGTSAARYIQNKPYECFECCRP